MIAKKEAVIWDAICSRVGGDRSVQNLVGRIELVTVAHSGVETFYLDDKPLVEFYPAEPTRDYHDYSHYVGFNQKYRIYPQGEKS
jgi:hypothetical protein